MEGREGKAETQQESEKMEEAPVSGDTTPVGKEGEEAQKEGEKKVEEGEQTTPASNDDSNTEEQKDDVEMEEADLDLKVDLDGLTSQEYKDELKKYQRLLMTAINKDIPPAAAAAAAVGDETTINASAASKNKKVAQNSKASTQEQRNDEDDDEEEVNEEVETRIKKILIASDSFKKSTGMDMIPEEDKDKLIRSLRSVPGLLDQFQHVSAVMSAASKHTGTMKTQYKQVIEQKNVEIKRLEKKNKELEENSRCINAINAVFNSAAGKFANRNSRVASPSGAKKANSPASAAAATKQTKIETTKQVKKAPKITLVESSRKNNKGSEEEEEEMNYSNLGTMKKSAVDDTRKRSAQKSGLGEPGSVVPPLGNSAASGGNKKPRTEERTSVERMRQEVNALVSTEGLSAFASDLKTADDAKSFINNYIQTHAPQQHGFDPLGVSLASRSYSKTAGEAPKDNLISLVCASNSRLYPTDTDPDHPPPKPNIRLTQGIWAPQHFSELTNFTLY